MPTEIIEKRSRKNGDRLFEVGLRISYPEPDDLTEGNDFLLEYINRDPLQASEWQIIGNYTSKKQAQEAADSFVGSVIKIDDWQ